jgi:hypothetical protein
MTGPVCVDCGHSPCVDFPSTSPLKTSPLPSLIRATTVDTAAHSRGVGWLGTTPRVCAPAESTKTCTTSLGTSKTWHLRRSA